MWNDKLMLCCRLQYGNLVASDMRGCVPEPTIAVDTVLWGVHLLGRVSGSESPRGGPAIPVASQASPHTGRNIWSAPSCGAPTAYVCVHVQCGQQSDCRHLTFGSLLAEVRVASYSIHMKLDHQRRHTLGSIDRWLFIPDLLVIAPAHEQSWLVTGLVKSIHWCYNHSCLASHGLCSSSSFQVCIAETSNVSMECFMSVGLLVDCRVGLLVDCSGELFDNGVSLALDVSI